MIQFIVPYSEKEKTPFQPLDVSVITEEDIISLIIEYNYRKVNDELIGALYSVNYKLEKDGTVRTRNLRIEYLINRLLKYNSELFTKYRLLLA